MKMALQRKIVCSGPFSDFTDIQFRSQYKVFAIRFHQRVMIQRENIATDYRRYRSASLTARSHRTPFFHPDPRKMLPRRGIVIVPRPVIYLLLVKTGLPGLTVEGHNIGTRVGKVIIIRHPAAGGEGLQIMKLCNIFFPVFMCLLVVTHHMRTAGKKRLVCSGIINNH